MYQTDKGKCMLKKDLMIPGAKLLVRTAIKSGVSLYTGYDQTLPYLSVRKDPGVMGSDLYKITSGEILTVSEKPKKRGESGNLAKVQTVSGETGYAYWCELRASCDHVFLNSGASTFSKA